MKQEDSRCKSNTDQNFIQVVGEQIIEDGTISHDIGKFISEGIGEHAATEKETVSESREKINGIFIYDNEIIQDDLFDDGGTATENATASDGEPRINDMFIGKSDINGQGKFLEKG